MEWFGLIYTSAVNLCKAYNVIYMRGCGQVFSGINIFVHKLLCTFLMSIPTVSVTSLHLLTFVNPYDDAILYSSTEMLIAILSLINVKIVVKM